MPPWLEPSGCAPRSLEIERECACHSSAPAIACCFSRRKMERATYGREEGRGGEEGVVEGRWRGGEAGRRRRGSAASLARVSRASLSRLPPSARLDGRIVSRREDEGEAVKLELDPVAGEEGAQRELDAHAPHVRRKHLPSCRVRALARVWVVEPSRGRLQSWPTALAVEQNTGGVWRTGGAARASTGSV